MTKSLRFDWWGKLIELKDQAESNRITSGHCFGKKIQFRSVKVKYFSTSCKVLNSSTSYQNIFISYQNNSNANINSNNLHLLKRISFICISSFVIQPITLHTHKISPRISPILVFLVKTGSDTKSQDQKRKYSIP